LSTSLHFIFKLLVSFSGKDQILSYLAFEGYKQKIAEPVENKPCSFVKDYLCCCCGRQRERKKRVLEIVEKDIC
jgi:hypothetical protein